MKPNVNYFASIKKPQMWFIVCFGCHESLPKLCLASRRRSDVCTCYVLIYGFRVKPSLIGAVVPKVDHLHTASSLRFSLLSWMSFDGRAARIAVCFVPIIGFDRSTKCVAMLFAYAFFEFPSFALCWSGPTPKIKLSLIQTLRRPFGIVAVKCLGTIKLIQFCIKAGQI